MPAIELDALYWEPNWHPAPRDTFRRRVEQAVRASAWVTDGNYRAVRDIVWSRADTLIWLDYPLPLILGRLLVRTVRRSLSQEELWNGNRERLWTQFCSRDSLLLWALQSHRRYRREYPVVFAQAYRQLTVVRLRSPRATRAWLRGLCP